MFISLVTNIPTPYRNYLFTLLNAELLKQGHLFEVHFMDWTEPNRHWKIERQKMDYPYKIHRGIHPKVVGAAMHINLSLIFSHLRRNKEIVIVGGYATPTHWLVALAVKFRHYGQLLIWTETNLLSEQRRSGLAFKIKRLILGLADAYIVPGHEAYKHTISVCSNADQKKFIYLPNIVEDEVYIEHIDMLRSKKGQLRRSFGIQNNEVFWVSAARLDEIKGLDLLIPALAGKKNIVLGIAGTGPQMPELISLSTMYGVKVIFLGHQEENEIKKLYAAGDAFVLFSRRDPYPLAPIEAIAAGLPVLLSKRLGNVKDVVRESENGFVVNIDNEMDIRKSVNGFSDLSTNILEKMGVRSREIFLETFAAKPVVKKFVSDLSGWFAHAHNRQ